MYPRGGEEESNVELHCGLRLSIFQPLRLMMMIGMWIERPLVLCCGCISNKKCRESKAAVNCDEMKRNVKRWTWWRVGSKFEWQKEEKEVPGTNENVINEVDMSE